MTQAGAGDVTRICHFASHESVDGKLILLMQPRGSHLNPITQCPHPTLSAEKAIYTPRACLVNLIGG